MRKSQLIYKKAVGVQRDIFDVMLEGDFGRPPKLSRADQFLMTLIYWLEYCTEFHIGIFYGISESAVCRTIEKVEDTLVKSEIFALGVQLLHKATKPSKSSEGRL